MSEKKRQTSKTEGENLLKQQDVKESGNMKFKKTVIFVLVAAIILLATASLVAIVLNPELVMKGGVMDDLIAKKEKGGRNMRELSDGLYAVIDTDKGEILLNLFFEKTPMTVSVEALLRFLM